jgi:hypothetical protein
MARYSEHDTSKTYAAVDRFRDACLRRDGSLLFDDPSIWTGSRGDVERVVALAAQLRALGAEVRVCAPPDQDFAELLAPVGVPLVPAGRQVRPMVTGAEWVAAQDDTVATAAEGRDALVATGVTPAGVSR